MTSTEVAPRVGNGVVRRDTSYSVMPMAARTAYASQLAQAGDLIPKGLWAPAGGGALSAPSVGKIFLVLEMGAMLGLEPMASLQGIDVIEGKAVISPQLFTGLVRGFGHKLLIEDSGTVAEGTYRVVVTLTRSDDPDNPISADWDLDRSERAGLGKITLNPANGKISFVARDRQGNAKPWEKYTEDMCLWRALGRLGRRGGNDILMGITYLPEELTEIVGEDGTRDHEVFDTADADIIGRIREIDDKADMRALYKEVQASTGWNPKISAEFDSHLYGLTKDRDAAPAGAPGNTGVPAIDALTKPGQGSTEPPAPATNAPESVQADPETLTEAHSAAEEDVVDAEPVDENGETETERYERISAEEADRYNEAQMNHGSELRGVPNTRPGFDSSALGK